jgi:hypothetical protein
MGLRGTVFQGGRYGETFSSKVVPGLPGPGLETGSLAPVSCYRDDQPGIRAADPAGLRRL